MSKAKFLSGALILAASFTAPALAVGSDVAHHSTLEANTGAYGSARLDGEKKVDLRVHHRSGACRRMNDRPKQSGGPT